MKSSRGSLHGVSQPAHACVPCPASWRPQDRIPAWLLYLMQYANFFSILLIIGGILCFVAYALDKSDASNLYLGIVLEGACMNGPRCSVCITRVMCERYTPPGLGDKGHGRDLRACEVLHAWAAALRPSEVVRAGRKRRGHLSVAMRALRAGLSPRRNTGALLSRRAPAQSWCL